jgi:hypothetical protein
MVKIKNLSRASNSKKWIGKTIIACCFLASGVARAQTALGMQDEGIERFAVEAPLGQGRRELLEGDSDSHQKPISKSSTVLRDSDLCLSLLPPTDPEVLPREVPGAFRTSASCLLPSERSDVEVAAPVEDPPALYAGASSNFVKIERVEVLGSKAFSSKELEAVVKPFIDAEAIASISNAIAIRSAITELYVRRGYLTSGAFLPPQQDISRGIITVQVIEAQLEEIEIEGLTHLNQSGSPKEERMRE